MFMKTLGACIGVVMMLWPLSASATEITCPRPREDQEWNKNEGRRYFSLGNTMFKAQKFPDAVLAFECVLRLVPYSMNTRHRLAQSYEQAGDLEKAREQYLLALADDSPEAEALRPSIREKIDELDQRINRGQSRPINYDAPPDEGAPDGPQLPPGRQQRILPGLLEDFPALRHRVELNFGLASSASAAPTGSLGYFFRQNARISWGANFGGMGFSTTSDTGAAITGKGYFLLPSAELMYLQYGGIFHVVVGGGLGYVFAQLENNQKQKANASSGFASLLLALDYRISASLCVRLTLRYQFLLGMTGPNDETIDSSTAGIYELGITYRF